MDKLVQRLRSQGLNYKIKLSGATEPGMFLPGDIVSFSYFKDSTKTQSSRLGLVIASDRAPYGRFVSTKRNILINIIDISSNNVSLFAVIEAFYKNRKTSSYSSGLIRTIFGGNNLKTFKVKRISNYKQVLLNK